ncbi:MAG: NAD(P)H-hydrate dehydratase [Alphaproteobacteria bacterium]|nr:NAD(P)H-hydrate dehydratase [Alphaproteobacteria bacterium]
MNDIAPLHHRAHALLTPEEMGKADQATIDSGTPGYQLMLRAGEGIVTILRRHFLKRSTVVLCGPGNNGGDGYVVARLLRELGWPVWAVAAVPDGKLRGDALVAASKWLNGGGKVIGIDDVTLGPDDLVVDAVFGAGLAREVDAAIKAMFDRVRRSGAAVLAVDLPSGVNGATGEIMGDALAADVTVTFFRGKPGHLLEPGRSLCGVTEVVDIGIPAPVLDGIRPQTVENGPGVWRHLLPAADPSAHKYQRGHVIMIAGTMPGAARLVCAGARHAGAGYVAVVADSTCRLALMQAEPGMVVAGEVPDLDPDKAQALVIGPGAHPTPVVATEVLNLTKSGVPMVLDAGALTALAGRASDLANHGGAIVLTPHEGEFASLFPDIAGDKLSRARQAAAATNTVVVLKGRDTVIAAPDGRAAVNSNAPETLAVAGSGDVLAGLLATLLATGMPPFEAACCAVYRHGLAGHQARLPEEIAAAIPAI